MNEDSHDKFDNPTPEETVQDGEIVRAGNGHRDVAAAWKDAGDRLGELGAALRVHFDAVGAAVKDDAVRQDVREAGRSIVGALGVTVTQASREVRKVAGEWGRGPRRPGGRSGDSSGDGSGDGSGHGSGNGTPPVEPWGTP